jgi:hypothetical protein
MWSLRAPCPCGLADRGALVGFDGRQLAAGVRHGDGLSAGARAKLGGTATQEGAGRLLGDAKALAHFAGGGTLSHAAQCLTLARAQGSVATAVEPTTRLGESRIAIGRAGADVVQGTDQLVEWGGASDRSAHALVERGGDLAQIVALGVEHDGHARGRGELAADPAGGRIGAGAHQRKIEPHVAVEINGGLHRSGRARNLKVRSPESMRERFPWACLVVDQHQHCPTSWQSPAGRATGFPPNGHRVVRQVTPELRSNPVPRWNGRSARRRAAVDQPLLDASTTTRARLGST